MSDEIMSKFIHSVVMDEIVPQVNLPIDEVKEFANSVFERFENPFIDHALLSISLNSVSKWKARVLPSLKDYYKNNGKLPKLITFSFAALLAFYSSTDLREDGLYAKRANGDSYVIHDDRTVLEFFAKNVHKTDFVEKACKNIDFWGEDLSSYDGFAETVAYWYKRVLKDAKSAITDVLR